MAAKRTMRARVGIWVALAMAISAIFLFSARAGDADTPLGDGEQIVVAALELQAAGGRAVCVDRRTASDPLVVWRSMAAAPQPSRALVGWSSPRPLTSLTPIGLRSLIEDQLGRRRIFLREPQPAQRVARRDQHLFDAAARQLSLIVDRQPVTMREGWGGGSTVARSWVFNRLAPSCSPHYEFSDPKWLGAVGFLTVKSDHWGTTYALRKGVRGWSVVGQWTPWLY